VIALATLVGLGIALSGVGAIKALFLAAIVNGVISPLLIAAIVVVSNDERIVGEHRNSRLTNVLGWATVTIMGTAAVFLGVTWVVG
jgi:Mn2+/Fe2+ NRAMP family transporter